MTLIFFLFVSSILRPFILSFLIYFDLFNDFLLQFLLYYNFIYMIFILPLPHRLTTIYHNKLWKILKEMGIPDHLICLLKNLYAGQEATVRTGHGTTDWFQIGKGIRQGCILSPAYLTYM